MSDRSMRPLVLLFDVDGTLISSGGAGRRAIERAFTKRFGRPDACARFSFGGMTDRAIARAGLEAIGARSDDAAIDALLEVYLEELASSLGSSSAWRVHDGILEALDAASSRARCAIGLGTGNVKKGAALKLGHVGLFERFSFGGFGCDHETRSELLRIGAQRGADVLGAPIEECRVVIIGDTPKDVAAARAIGAECIAVATGGASIDDLRACAPAFVFSSLASDGALDALLA